MRIFSQFQGLASQHSTTSGHLPDSYLALAPARAVHSQACDPTHRQRLTSVLEFLVILGRRLAVESSQKIRLLMFSLFFIALIVFAILYSPVNAVSRPASKVSGVLIHTVTRNDRCFFRSAPCSAAENARSPLTSPRRRWPK